MRITDPRVMRALAHPARIEIVEYLHDTGAVVTATECAGMVGLSPSATSYHLRELAKYGLVEQAPSRGDGRERVWRSVGTGVHIDADPADGPDTRAASHALIDMYLNRDLARVRQWVERQDDEPAEWRGASAMMGQRLLLTPDELRELNGQVRDLLEPYRLRDRRDTAPEGARKVAVNYMAFPEV
ncbi:transcriptional regulator [Paractinoplanes rishiriensis]|uniref:Transcriptional regulator n=1 Tax=Paractinoplanes rishiriensis TaxID=1050105 RepID=A0A919JZP8_9ACTN|nr:transcriptional regulator [Actinoplanes rishiriensis]